MNTEKNKEMKSTLLKEIKSLLNNRRTVFFRKYPDARKQQIILDAEGRLFILQKADESRFLTVVKEYADRYILPLVPSQSSPMHKSVMGLYEKIKSL